MASLISIGLLPLLCTLQALDSALSAKLHVFSKLNCSRHMRGRLQAQEVLWMLAISQHEWGLLHSLLPMLASIIDSKFNHVQMLIVLSRSLGLI